MVERERKNDGRRLNSVSQRHNVYVERRKDSRGDRGAYLDDICSPIKCDNIFDDLLEHLRYFLWILCLHGFSCLNSG